MAEKFISHADESKLNWGRDSNDRKETSWVELQFGCLQRIAAAVELMAKNHAQLIREKKRAEEDRDGYKRRALRAEASNRSLRGWITRLKSAQSVEKK